MSKIQEEKWSSRVGVIFAVSGSAVGLGNFLRFPGLVAEYGGGAFMIAYIISFLLIGLPICWAEWAMGRQGGQNGFNSSPSIFSSITNNKRFKYLGVVALMIPIGIYFYYLIIESWCLAYAANYLLGNLQFNDTEEAVSFFHKLVGVFENGSAFSFDIKHIAIFVIIALAINFHFVSKGISKGIERFCVMAMPLLLIIALIILVRVITLGTPDPAQPNNNIASGLGYMWNPSKTVVEIRDTVDAPWKSGVIVDTITKSIVSGSNFFFFIRSLAAFIAKYEVAFPFSLSILLFFIPVLAVIHSSFVSTIFSKSLFEIKSSGT